MLDIIKAMQDPEFINGLQQMPQQILDKLNRIEFMLEVLLQESGHSISDIDAFRNAVKLTDVDTTEDTKAALQHHGIAVEQQNSISANLQNGLTETPEPVSINPVDPDSYK